MIRARLELGPDDLVVELASNDGYLLQHFVGTGVPILGIDPAANVAKAAEERGVPTLVEFFGRETAEQLVGEGKRASLIVGNNVLAQVPDLNDFVGGVKILLRDGRHGDVRVPTPAPPARRAPVRHDLPRALLLLLARDDRRDPSQRTGSRSYDVEELWTHGGSLRVYAQHAGGPHDVADAVATLLAHEEAEGLRSLERYARFAEDVKESKRALLELLDPASA